jgi:hypothetical protein
MQTNASGWTGTANPLVLTNLPFTVNSSATQRGGGYCTFTNALTLASTLRCEQGTTTASFFRSGTSTPIVGNDLTGASTVIEIVITYSV